MVALSHVVNQVKAILGVEASTSEIRVTSPFGDAYYKIMHNILWVKLPSEDRWFKSSISAEVLRSGKPIGLHAYVQKIYDAAMEAGWW